MPIQNIFGLMLPIGVVLAIGAIVIGMIYRERAGDYSYQDSLGGDFDPGTGYDTSCKRSRKKDEEEDEKCIICIEAIKRFQQIRVLPCAHRFHTKCIGGWLRYERFCPLCKTVVP